MAWLNEVGSCPLRCRFPIQKRGTEIILRQLNLLQGDDFFKVKKTGVRNFDQVWDLYRFFLNVICSKVMVGSYSEQTKLLFDFDEIMTNKNLSEEQSMLDFKVETFSWEIITDIRWHFWFFILEDLKEKRMNFFTTKQQNVLYSFLKEHVGWLCPHSFQKKKRHWLLVSLLLFWVEICVLKELLSAWRGTPRHSKSYHSKIRTKTFSWFWSLLQLRTKLIFIILY